MQWEGLYETISSGQRESVGGLIKATTMCIVVWLALALLMRNE